MHRHAACSAGLFRMVQKHMCCAAMHSTCRDTEDIHTCLRNPYSHNDPRTSRGLAFWPHSLFASDTMLPESLPAW